MITERITMIQIDYFMAVAEHLSYTKAAQSLYVSQPSLSKQIALLENELDMQLFHRTKRKVQLTSSGVVLYKELYNIKQRLNAAFENARDKDFHCCESIRIGCLSALETTPFLPHMINKLKGFCPDIDISLELHPLKMLREKFESGIFDVVFNLESEVPQCPNYSFVKVGHTEGAIFMSKSYHLASKKRLTVDDIRGEPFVLIERNESPLCYDFVIKTCLSNNFSPIITKHFPNPESLMLYVKAGLGLTIMPSPLRGSDDSWYKAFAYSEIDGFDNLGISDIVMIWKTDNCNGAIKILAEA